MKKLRILLMLLFVTQLPIGTAAAKVIDSADNRFDFAGNVIADRSIGGDYIAFGQNVKLESGVSGDIIALGRNIIITDDGAVQNIFAAGQHIDVRTRSARNMYAAGGDITVNAGTELKGAYLVGANITFGGTARDVYMAGASVTADGIVNGNMIIRSDNITFGRNVSVGGHLTVIGTVKPQLPPNIDPAKMTFRRLMHVKGEDRTGPPGVSRFQVIMAAAGVVTSVLLALLLTLFRGAYFRARAAGFKKRAWKDLLIGLLTFIVVPVGALICLLTVFAIPVSVIVLVFYAMALYLAPVATGVILGRLLLPGINRYLSSALGAAAIRLLLLVPVLKFVLFLLCAFYTLGIAVMTLKPHRENPAG
jgi:hypothetical protein